MSGSAVSPMFVPSTPPTGRSAPAASLSATVSERIASLAAITVMMLCAEANLCDVYADTARWLVVIFMSTALGLAAAVCVWSRAGWLSLVVMSIGQLLLGPAITMGPRFWEYGIAAVAESFKVIIAVAPPIGTDNGSLMAAWTIGLWLTFMAGICALHTSRIMALMSALPLGVALAVCALLGTTDGWYRVPCGIVFAVTLMLWWAVRLGTLAAGRLVAIVATLCCTAVVTWCCTGLLTTHRLVLRDHYVPPFSKQSLSSPLSGMRSYVARHRDDALLSVTGLPAGVPVRLAVMDRFDGSVWNLSDQAADFRRAGAALSTHVSGETFEALFTVESDFEELWLPLAGDPITVDFNSTAVSPNWYVNADTGAALIANGLTEGFSYTESGVAAPAPDHRRIAKAQAELVHQPESHDVPDVVGEWAVSITSGNSTAGAAALALEQTLRDAGWFSHGLDGDYPSAAGHGSYRINSLLSGDAMVGDSEQYASAMALMAREVGLSSRVVLGFPNNANTTANESESDSKEPVTFTGEDLAAWVEIKLRGLGWVAFYPTPDASKIPDDHEQLSPPNPRTLIRQPPVPLVDPLRDELRVTGESTIAGSPAVPDIPTPAPPVWRHVAYIAVIVSSPLWVMACIGAIIIACKAVMLAMARTRGDGSDRMTAGWRAVAVLAAQCGISVHGTRREQASHIAHALAIHQQTVCLLASDADYAAFSGRPITKEQAATYWHGVTRMRCAMLRALPRMRRIKARVSLRGQLALLADRHIRPPPICRKSR
ncbi:transglutaminaseTgpA domain-containing protein [Bifidobacterium oedipodis]|uniref:Transglutaminase n=1 Tax=Bifidobacterium oedipodis TaxID=2675322 RepID=A0A7Y0EPR2_9BIFI|nr:transglutaminase domain-containing protein [Bifidobacterium sp. DSM 109957]NMM93778.1 transglutaminase [Bifidobacterium sp. DSM 109957]